MLKYLKNIKIPKVFGFGYGYLPKTKPKPKRLLGYICLTEIHIFTLMMFGEPEVNFELLGMFT